MTDPAFRSHNQATREKQRVIYFCAPVTLSFAIADTLQLGGFSPTVFAVRLAWTLLIVATAWLLPRVDPLYERHLMVTLAAASSAFFGVLVWMTGGYGSPLYHFILAMPMVIAVVLQEHPRATAAAASVTMITGLAITAVGTRSVSLCLQWGIQALGMATLAVYASVTYRKLRVREQSLREAGLVAEERARASDEAVHARDEFLSVASHELRTPLTALKLQVQRLLRQPSLFPQLSPEKNDNIVGRIDRQVDRLVSMVDTLLDLSRIQADRLPVEVTSGDLVSTVQQAVERCAPLAQRVSCALTVNAAAPVTAVFDGGRLEQVLSNLITNAAKFGAGQPIEIAVGVNADRAVITVRDHGIGIAPEDQARIFERFERAVPTRNFGGLGLGLWISRRIVQRMGGSLEVESRPGEGATFTIQLPLASAALTGVA